MSGKMRFPQFPIRINPKIMNKLKYIAYEESRVVNKVIEKLIIRHISEYEEKYGEISEEDIERMLNSLE